MQPGLGAPPGVAGDPGSGRLHIFATEFATGLGGTGWTRKGWRLWAEPPNP
jgi:hypothetical protein